MALLSPTLSVRGISPDPATYWAIGETHWYKASKKFEVIMYGFLNQEHRLTGLHNKIDTKGFMFDSGDSNQVDLGVLYYLIKTTPEFSDSYDALTDANDDPIE